jgi:uncharacterized protein (UPF0332 family)
MDMNDCFKKGFIKKTSVDRELIHSLIEMADITEQAVESARIDEVNISVYVSLAYDSLRQVLEALCVLNGYKVISHICIGELLNQILDEFDFDEFDRMRWIRNSINYYGEKVDFEQGKQLISKMFTMKRTISNRYLSSVLGDSKCVLSKRTLRDIKQAEKEIAEGKTIPLDKIKRKIYSVKPKEKAGKP